MAGNEYIYANLSTREATGSTGSPLTFSWVAGQSVSYALRFLQRDSAGALGETELSILNLRAAIGREGAWPESGWYKIKVGTAPSTAANTTERIDFNAGALEVEEALNALTGKPAAFRCDEGANAILIRRVDGGEVALSVVGDGLRPTSFGKILGGRRFPERKARLSLGGSNGLTFISKLEGEAGNAISVRYVAPSVDTAMSVAVAGSKITVNLSRASGALTATAATIKAAVDASASASALVGVALLETGSATAAAQAEVFLSGGMNPSGHEYSLQLAQAPVVFTDSTTVGLPPVPVITRVQSGGRSGGFPATIWNTIQALAVPPDFRGAYQFKRGLKRSALASKEDGTVAIGRILNTLLAEDGGTVTVTNPNNNVAHIEFGGTFAGYDIADLEIVPYSTPSPNYVFDLDLGSADLAEMLQDKESVTLPFEVDATVWQNPADPSEGTKTIKLWKTTATIKRNVLWDALAVRPPIDWLRRPMPVDYVPFSDTQFLVGQQAAYTAVIGNGSTKNFTIDHGLGGGVEQVGQSTIYKDEGVVSVDVRENKPSGRQLRDDEYVLRFTTAGSVSLEFGEAPDEDGLVVVVLGYGQKSAFTIHTHPIDQIKTITQSGAVGESLRVILEDFQARIARLELLLPRGSVSSLGSGLEKKKVQIPPIGEILPDIAMEGGGGDPLSLASQIIAPAGKGQDPKVVAGTELEDQKKLFDAELLRVKAEAAAELKAAQEAAAKAAVDVKVKADQEAAQKKTSMISRVSIAEFATRLTAAGTASTTALPNLYPAMRNGRYAWLLPAIHDAAAQDVSALPTLAAAAGNVYRNAGSLPLSLPAGGGRKGQSVPAGGFFGGDGRALYALRRAGTSTSYHPIEMERELLRVVVRAAQFPLASDLSLAWQLDLSFLTETMVAGAGYVMSVEAAPLSSASTPATTGANVGAVGQAVLLAAPRIGFSRGVSETRQFALKLTRKLNESGQAIGASQFTDYVESIGPELPQGDFLLTVRLAQWDVDDSTPAPTGQVSVLMPATQMTVEQTV
jgi:hypothetical protein